VSGGNRQRAEHSKNGVDMGGAFRRADAGTPLPEKGGNDWQDSFEPLGEVKLGGDQAIVVGACI